MLLLFFSGGQGVFIWSGPNPARTVMIEPEFRTVLAT